MAGFSTLEMALAVRDAGGLGSLACAPFDAQALEERLAAAKRESPTAPGTPLNLNFFAHTPQAAIPSATSRWMQRLAPYYQRSRTPQPAQLDPGVLQPFDESRCEVVVAHRAKVVSFHFGLPGGHLVDALKGVGTVVMSSATTVREARWLAERGCDVIIAQGSEAGGHRGSFLDRDQSTQLGTFALIPQIADAVDVPVVAAGGIADGRGVAAAFALGACGVQLGTAFLFTREARVSSLHLDAIRAAATTGTSITNVFSGHPARCVTNDAVREMGPIADGVPPFPLGMAAMAPLRVEAEARGSRAFSPHYCGQTAPLCSQGLEAVSGLVGSLVDDAQRCFGRLGVASR